MLMSGVPLSPEVSPELCRCQVQGGIERIIVGEVLD
jgi:hypothetical protein